MKRTDDTVAWLKSLKDDKNAEGMKRFGIKGDVILGVSTPNLRAKAKELKRDHQLALELWATGIHEACLLATMIADAKVMSREQADSWTEEFDSWDICDQCCMNLYVKLPFAHELITDYALKEDEFVRRAAFALIAALAVKDKKCGNDMFIGYLNLIKDYSADSRNFVRKAVDWALRQIGKRNMVLNEKAIDCARVLSERDDKTSRWIGKNSLRELTSEKIIEFILKHRDKETPTTRK